MGFGDLIASFPEWARVAAVAEPRDEYREGFARKHGLEPGVVFRTWQEFTAQPRLCDAVVICTQDRDHVGPAVACTRLGYHMLLEKPMAVTLADCRAIAAAQREAGTITAVCHSMRYHQAFGRLRELVTEGRLGRIVTVDQIEQVAWWHQAHSFVRGNWSREDESSFMLLAKSCHDIDYLSYLVGLPCLRVASFGALTYFRPENAPAGSSARCVDCALEPGCAYSAIRHYVRGNRERWPADVVSYDHSEAAHLRAVETGPYGRCVWKCGNDVVDHQVVLLEYAGDVTATFTMTAFTARGGRLLRVHGTDAEATFQDEGRIVLRTFATGREEEIGFEAEEGGHGGGDARVMRSWLRAVVESDPAHVLTDVQESLRTHTVVFAAEKSRRERRMVEIAAM
jgi:predicted dehydrogenase